MIGNQYPQAMLDLIDNMPIKELFIKLELLDWQENIIKEIQGLLTGGNISINGNSAVRRTCSLTFTAEDTTQIDQFIKLDTKFRLFIGLKNRLPIQYKDYGEIIWFNGGVYVFTNASFTHNASNITVNVSAKDKMGLLNGEVGGVSSDTIILHERLKEEVIEATNEIISIYESPTVFQIIQELVNHYGEEKLQNIFINDVPNQPRQLMSYMGDTYLV